MWTQAGICSEYVLAKSPSSPSILAKPSAPEVPGKDNGELRDEQIEDAGEEGGACSKDVIPPVEDGKEDGSTNPDPAGGTKEPELKKSKTCLIPKVIATPVRLHSYPKDGFEFAWPVQFFTGRNGSAVFSLRRQCTVWGGKQ